MYQWHQGEEWRDYDNKKIAIELFAQARCSMVLHLVGACTLCGADPSYEVPNRFDRFPKGTTSNTKVLHYISELTQQYFYSGISTTKRVRLARIDRTTIQRRTGSLVIEVFKDVPKRLIPIGFDLEIDLLLNLEFTK